MIVPQHIEHLLLDRYPPSVARRVMIFWRLMTEYPDEELLQVYPQPTISQYRRMLRSVGIDVGIPVRKRGRPPGRRLTITPETTLDDLLQVYQPSTLRCDPYRRWLTDAGIPIPPAPQRGRATWHH